MKGQTQRLANADERINAVKQHVRTHLDHPLNRETLAGIAGFSVPHLHRLFTASVGESPASYVHRLRMERAGRKLCVGAVDIGSVALAAGYESHAAFSKAFKRHFGLTTSAFRQLDCWTATRLLKHKCSTKGQTE